jgi:hypothetical protein
MRPQCDHTDESQRSRIPCSIDTHTCQSVISDTRVNDSVLGSNQGYRSRNLLGSSQVVQYSAHSVVVARGRRPRERRRSCRHTLHSAVGDGRPAYDCAATHWLPMHSDSIIGLSGAQRSERTVSGHRGNSPGPSAPAPSAARGSAPPLHRPNPSPAQSPMHPHVHAHAHPPLHAP